MMEKVATMTIVSSVPDITTSWMARKAVQRLPASVHVPPFSLQYQTVSSLNPALPGQRTVRRHTKLPTTASSNECLLHLHPCIPLTLHPQLRRPHTLSPATFSDLGPPPVQHFHLTRRILGILNTGLDPVCGSFSFWLSPTIANLRSSIICRTSHTITFAPPVTPFDTKQPGSTWTSNIKRNGRMSERT